MGVDSVLRIEFFEFFEHSTYKTLTVCDDMVEIFEFFEHSPYKTPTVDASTT